MAKNVALAEDVYETLEQMKEEGQSFSDFIRQMAEQERTRRLKNLAGAWKMTDKEHEALVKSIYDRRARSKSRRAVL